MSYPLALLIIFALILSVFILFFIYRYIRRSRLERMLSTMVFPQAWREQLEDTMHYLPLDADRKAQIERNILRFVHTKHFTGIGMKVTEPMKVIIGFYACYIVQNRPGYCYPQLQEVLVYADAFMVNEIHEQGGIVSEEHAVLDGQSSHDTVVLAWPDVEAEAYAASEHNVVIHEFAHILDFEDGISDGFPVMTQSQAPHWEKTLEHELHALQQAVDHGHLSEKHQLLGHYAATNEAEFFAVATERYFMVPDALRHHYPRLFELLDTYYTATA